MRDQRNAAGKNGSVCYHNLVCQIEEDTVPDIAVVANLQMGKIPSGIRVPVNVVQKDASLECGIRSYDGTKAGEKTSRDRGIGISQVPDDQRDSQEPPQEKHYPVLNQIDGSREKTVHVLPGTETN